MSAFRAVCTNTQHGRHISIVTGASYIQSCWVK